MANKLSAIVMAMVLGAVVMAPLAAAHLTASSLLLPGGALAMDGTTDACRAQGAGPCNYNDGMSGTYRGTGGVHVSSDQFPLAVASLALVCVGRTTYDNAGTLVPANRFCEIGTPSGCDTEWLIDGPFPGNEAQVEGGTANGADPSGGMVPDGLFDDGGDFGAVCHTNNGPATWQTSGCGTPGEKAYAKDANPAMNVVGGVLGAPNGPWISNECDYLTPIIEDEEGNEWFDCVVNQGVLGSDGVSGFVGGTLPGGDGEPTAVEVATFLADVCGPMLVELVTALVPGTPTVPEPGEIVPIIEGIVTDLLTPPSDEPVIGQSTCGSDAGPDVANYGYGSVGVANVEIGMDNPVTGTPQLCQAGDAIQWGFVRDYVNVDVNGGSQPTDLKVGVTSGWYDVR